MSTSREARQPAAFDGQVVAITGASSGLGANLAEAIAAAKGKPVLFARSRENLEAVAARCRNSGGEPHVVNGDVTLPEDCARLVGQTIERFGRLDVLLACAGIGMWTRFDQINHPGILKQVMDVNYCGVVNPACYALPHLKQSRGMLVVISSVQGKVGVPYHTGYSASKHAVHGFCDSLRMELRGTGVDVLTVLAHWIQGTSLRVNALGPDGARRGHEAHGHGPGAVAVDDACRAILEAITKRRRSLFLPGKLRYLTWLSAVAPSLAERIIIQRVEKENSRKPG